MRLTPSGDYALPGPLKCLAGNIALTFARLLPPRLLHPIVRDHLSYQVSGAGEIDNFQGISLNKLDAMRLPPTLAGKSVIDLGCSEGFFCRECAKRGASK